MRLVEANSRETGPFVFLIDQPVSTFFQAAVLELLHASSAWSYSAWTLAGFFFLVGFHELLLMLTVVHHLVQNQDRQCHQVHLRHLLCKFGPGHQEPRTAEQERHCLACFM